MVIRYFFIMTSLAFLTGCNAPPRGFWNIPAQRVTAGPDIFDVRQRENDAVAVRLNTAYRPRLSAVTPQARQAIEQATGCDVVGPVTGDPIIIYAVITC